MRIPIPFAFFGFAAGAAARRPCVNAAAWSIGHALPALTLALPALFGANAGSAAVPVAAPAAAPTPLALPAPALRGTVSLEQALAARRSVRDYAAGALTLAQLAQLLWAAQGITATAQGLRTAPSAGALYPLEVYVAVHEVSGLPAGVYRYLPHTHALQLVVAHSVRAELARDALAQAAVARAPATLVLAAVSARTRAKYGERAARYVQLEAGHAAQNVLLQTVALGLGAVVIGAFDDARLRRTLALRAGEEPLCLLPVGRPAGG